MGWDAIWGGVQTIGGNAASAASDAFGSAPLGASPETRAWVNDWFGPKEGGNMIGNAFGRANMWAFDNVTALGDGAVRSAGALYAGGQSVAYDSMVAAGAPTNLARDVVSMPDAFLGSPGSLARSGGAVAREASAGRAVAREAAVADEAGGANGMRTSLRPADEPARPPRAEENACTTCRAEEEAKKKKKKEEEEAAARNQGQGQGQGAGAGTSRDPQQIMRQEDADPSARYTGEVYRGDTRTPEEIRAAGGFTGAAPGNSISVNDHMAPGRQPSDWISTTTDPQIAAGYAQNPWPLGATSQNWSLPGGTIYRMDVDGGVNMSAFGQTGNAEIAVSNPIPWSSVREYATVPPGTWMEVPTTWTPNPDYVPPR